MKFQGDISVGSRRLVGHLNKGTGYILTGIMINGYTGRCGTDLYKKDLFHPELNKPAKDYINSFNFLRLL